MGANAQTTVPSFTVGQVLTADQQNQSARTGVPVFATTVERDAAFGGSGEKTLAEGQLAYLEDSNIVQYYDGSSWATVGPTTSGGLVPIIGETAFTSTTSWQQDGVFTSAYTNYFIQMRTTAASAAGIRMVLRASGVDTTTNYTSQILESYSTTTASSRQTDNLIGYANTQSFTNLFLSAPQLATPTLWLSQNENGATVQLWQQSGIQSDSTQFDGIKVTFGSGTGYYAIFGIAK